MIPELLNGTSHGFPKRSNNVLHMHKLFVDRASKERHAVDALNSSVFGPTRLFCQKLLMHTQKHTMEMTHDELIARTVPAAAAVVREDHDAVCSRRD